MPPAPRRTFTADEDDAIVAAYAHATLTAIAASLGCDRWQDVQVRVNALIRAGRLDRRARHYHPPWTEEEDEYLAGHWGLLPDRAVARHLGRTVTACQLRAKRSLGLARKDQFYTLRHVARLMGVDDHLVRRWVREGLLRARTSAVRCGDGNRAWRVEDADLRTFLRDHPHRYDVARIESGTWWRRYAEEVAAADPWLTLPEAAARLGVAQETLRRYVRARQIAAVRVPGAGGHGALRFSALAVEEARRRLPRPRVRPAGQPGVALADPTCLVCGRRFTSISQYRRRGAGGVCRWGCTDAQAGDDGCAWVETDDGEVLDLCTACAGQE